MWGVGTKLATAYDQPALGGVYKLGAVRDAGGAWQPKLKLSEQAVKTTIPGVLQVRRFSDNDGFAADMIYDQQAGVDGRLQIVDLKDPTRRKSVERCQTSADLLRPVFRGGQTLPAAREPLAAIRQRAAAQLAGLHPAILRRLSPHEFPVGIDVGLHERRHAMIAHLREPP